MSHKVALSLYIHVPFCIRKCPYCDFYSKPGRLIDESRYLKALIGELTQYRTLLTDDTRNLSSIFFGGGTPSLLSGDTVQKILAAVGKEWNLTPGCEITLEANPESCTQKKIELWQLAGINRISLGVQAVDDARLRLLERPHTVAMARQVIHWLSGWPRLNVDLIYATPGHTLAGWRDELSEVLDWGILHMSCYALTLEPGTPFYSAGLVMPDEDLAIEFFAFTRKFLTSHGVLPYEISNFAKTGHECRHNVNGWEYGDYLGIGPGAHGKWTRPDGTIFRSENPRDLEHYFTYFNSQPRLVSSEEARQECLMMGLRLTRGMSRKRFFQISGWDLAEGRKETIKTIERKKLIKVDAKRIRMTKKGMLLADTVMLELL